MAPAPPPSGRVVELSSQHVSLHDVPGSPADQDAFLTAVVGSALALQGESGGFEIDPSGEDVGDVSLGVTSLLLLARSRGIGPAWLPTSIEQSLRFHLRERVHRDDNPGYPNLRRRGAGVPSARYSQAPGAHPFGDWPATVWALLQAVDVLELGEGIVEPALLDELRDVAHGYWTWLTQLTFFNPQDTANQALGAVVGALMLADAHDRRGCAPQASRLRASAFEHYDLLRSQRLPDLGTLLFAEHGGAWDGNYGPASLSFLAQAHRVTGSQVFLDDGCDLARYVDERLAVRGFDVGGSRYLEQHLGFEATLGLRYFSGRVRADIGRYLGNRRHLWLMDAEGRGDGTAAPNGHFAFMAVWALQDDSTWFRQPPDVSRRHQLRRGDVSVSFDAALAPRLLQVAGTAVVRSVLDGQPGIAVACRTDVRPHVLARPLAPVRSVGADHGGWSLRLVRSAVSTREQVLVNLRTLYATDGERLVVVVLLDPRDLPAGAEVSLLTGMPYAEPGESGYRKVLQLATSSGELLDVGDDGRVVLTDCVTAGGMSLCGNGSARVSVPAPPPGTGRCYAGGAATRHQTLEQIAFELAPDPHGYGNPERALEQLRGTVLVEVLGGQPVGDDLALSATWSPAGSARLDPVLEAVPEGVRILLGDLEVVVGPAAGDAHGEPFLLLRTPPPLRDHAIRVQGVR